MLIQTIIHHPQIAESSDCVMSCTTLYSSKKYHALQLIISGLVFNLWISTFENVVCKFNIVYSIYALAIDTLIVVMVYEC